MGARSFFKKKNAAAAMPSTNTAGIWQMLNWYRLRRAYLDPLLDAMN
jgi:hypothetical protein